MRLTPNDLATLISYCFADYLRLVEPDSATQMHLGQIRVEAPSFEGLTAVVGRVKSRRGEEVTVIAAIEPTRICSHETGKKLAEVLESLELVYGNPVLCSVTYLSDGRPGIRLENACIAEAVGIELARIYFASFGLSESRGDHYLERPEPLAWALAPFMRPGNLSRESILERALDQLGKLPDLALRDVLAGPLVRTESAA